jgi:hypothetical protein
MLVEGKILPQEALMSRDKEIIARSKVMAKKHANKDQRGFNKLRVHSVFKLQNAFKDHQAKNQDQRLHKIADRKERSQAKIMLLLVRREVKELKEDQEGYSNMNCFEIKNRLL